MKYEVRQYSATPACRRIVQPGELARWLIALAGYAPVTLLGEGLRDHTQHPRSEAEGADPAVEPTEGPHPPNPTGT